MSDYTYAAVSSSIAAAPTSAPRPPEAQPGGAPLGIVARFPATASESGKLWGVGRQVHRFALQSAARDIVPRERVALCLRRPIPTRPTVDVLYSPRVQSAHYSGLQVCGSVWMCPPCASKITERRRIELQAGISSWPGRVILVTFTLRHFIREGLSHVLNGLLKCYEDLRSRRSWREFSQFHDLYGSIRALEVTYGDNGWHPHLHVLMFTGSDIKIIPFEQQLKEQWQHVLNRSGRYASWLHGVDVRFSDADIAGYVAKFGRETEWTLAHEVTKSPVKQGRAGGRSPIQLLEDYLVGDEVAGRHWLEYAVNFKGLKQLVWSRGLRSLLGLDDEASDQDLAEQHDELSVLLASLTREQWGVVLGNDARGELLEVAASGDAEAVYHFLAGLGAV